MHASNTHFRSGWLFLAALAVVIAIDSPTFGQGMLQTIRDDVRGQSPAQPATSPSREDSYDDRAEEDDRDRWACGGTANDSCGSNRSDESPFRGIGAVCLVASAVVTSPLWVPHSLLGDDFSDRGYFHHFRMTRPKATLPPKHSLLEQNHSLPGSTSNTRTHWTASKALTATCSSRPRPDWA